MRAQFLVMASILVLAALLVGASLSGIVIPEETLRDQVRNCGVVGFISFVGLCLVAGARQAVAAAVPPLLTRRLSDPAHAAARRALYEKLRELGLPSK